ncbi:MAG: hypothetical protein MPI95_02355 [Nitrosopumilus sp.]|nr:hypothetical protein [Nitrosopumilus sp.]MDA7957924.1 hypothetical protein [Nitrosopumilus sp.]
MILPVAVAALVVVSLSPALAQEAGRSTYQEIATVIYEPERTIASVTLQTTSPLEIRLPGDLLRRLAADPRVVSVVATNADPCVPGADGRSCVLVNVARDPSDNDIGSVQDTTRRVGDEYIAEINAALGTGAEYHSSFLHTRGTVQDVSSAVYVEDPEHSRDAYARLAGLLAPEIRSSGGFYDAALKIAEEGGEASLSVAPSAQGALIQLRSSVERGAGGERIDPLGMLGVGVLERSSYFAGGFYPLSSIVQVLAQGSGQVHGAREVPSRIVDGEAVPVDLEAPGWIFNAADGSVSARYVFGTDASASAGDLAFSIGDPGQDIGGYAVLAGILAAAAGAAAFYMRGYRSQ